MTDKPKTMTRKFLSVFGERIELTVPMHPHKETQCYFEVDEVMEVEKAYYESQGRGEEWQKLVDSGKFVHAEPEGIQKLLKDCQESEFALGESQCCDDCEWHGPIEDDNGKVLSSGGRELCENCGLILDENVRLWGKLTDVVEGLISFREEVAEDIEEDNHLCPKDVVACLDEIMEGKWK